MPVPMTSSLTARMVEAKRLGNQPLAPYFRKGEVEILKECESEV